MVQEKLCLCSDFSFTYSFLLSKGSFQLYKFLVLAKLTTGKWTRIIPNIRTVEVGIDRLRACFIATLVFLYDI